MEKILFIDDNEDMLNATIEALGFEGYEVYGAKSGHEGLEIIRTNKPDLILCDIMMPGLTGFELIRKIKSDPSTSLVPFIFFTAVSEFDKLRIGMEEGADDYLIKPVTIEELTRSIRTRLKKSKNIKDDIKQKLDNLRGQILHVMPHEMLTPLHGILGFSNIIKEDISQLSKEEIKSMVEAIESSGVRLHNMVLNYINYAVATLKKEPVEDLSLIMDVNKSIEVISTSVALKYNRINDLILDLRDLNLKILLEDFEYIIKELVDNAFKFSEEKSHVVVSMNVNNGCNNILITDHGMGFPIEEMSDIGAFNQFNRKKLEQQGSGLGLITSMLIVQKYKGKILINNDKLGTTVTLQLPQ